jgi:hypothetical protein
MTSTEGKGRFKDAYELALPEMLALPESELVTINLDVPAVATATLGAWPEIAAFGEQVKALPGFDASQFGKVETYALATVYAHGQFMMASAPAVVLPELSEKALAARQVLLADAMALATRGLVDGGPLRELKGPIGYRNVSMDIVALVGLFRKHWPQISSKTALTSAEIDTAEKVADDLLYAVGRRDQAPVVVAAATETRQRAFTLLVKAYDQARRAIGFIRWDKGDIEDIAPSLYAGRIAPKSRKAIDNESKSDTAPVTAPVALPSGEPAASLRAAPAMTAVQPTAATTVPVPVPVGYLGSDPFGT